MEALYSKAKPVENNQELPLDFLGFCRFFTFKRNLASIAEVLNTKSDVALKSMRDVILLV